MLLTVWIAAALAGGPVTEARRPPDATSPDAACAAATMPSPIDAQHLVEDGAAFDRASPRMSVRELVALLGPASADVGSGLHVLVWKARDGRRLRVSAADFCGPLFAFQRFDR